MPLTEEREFEAAVRWIHRDLMHRLKARGSSFTRVNPNTSIVDLVIAYEDEYEAILNKDME